MGKDTGQSSSETAYRRGSEESKHSHFELDSARGKWDAESKTDFAITSVNVPDRLDTQEVRARAAADDSLPKVRRFHPDDIRRALRWLVVGAVLVGAGWWAARLALSFRDAAAPAGIEARVGDALGSPVSVADTRVRWLPAPQLVITGLVAQAGFRLPEVVVNLNPRDLLQGGATSGLTVGEARVGPAAFSGEEALAILRSARAAGRLPAAVATIRFESVTFPDVALLPGRYEVVLRREVGRAEFGSIHMKRLDTEGRLDIEVTPPLAEGENASFTLAAAQWRAGVGPAVVWDEAMARGEFGAGTVRVESYSVGARFGNLNGAALLSRDGPGWQVTGNIRSADLSLEDLARYLSMPAAAGSPAASAPLLGAARFDLQARGRGASVEEALQAVVASGPFSVPGAVVSGINLGAAATQGGAAGAGGSTRLVDLRGEASVSRRGLAVSGLAGSAGSLRVSGGFAVDPQAKVEGLLRAEVASPRGVSSAAVRLSGPVAALSFR